MRGVLALAVACAVTTSAASAQVTLTFEGLASGYVNSLDGSGYGGFTWSGFNVLDSSYLNGYQGGYVSGAVSPTHVAYNFNESTASTVTRADPFNFNSAYLTGAYNDGLSVTVVGRRQGAQLYTTTLTVNADSPTFHQFDYLGIDELQVFSSGGTRSSFVTYGGSGNYVVIDNFKFTPVPEPAGLLVAAVGTGLLARRLRRG